MLKIITVVGARPQFIKAAAVSRAIATKFSSQINEILIHTGQHFDANMSEIFFDELEIPKPVYNLEISGGPHGAMTGRMLESIETVLLKEKPDWVLIYGDTNSTLAGALAAAKIHIPVAHVEAGLRSFNMRMPEELNRILSDRVSSLLFCPTDLAVKNLSREGICKGVFNVGDVMFDVALHYKHKAQRESFVLKRLGVDAGNYALATCHRAENTDDPDRLAEILGGLTLIAKQLPVVLPLHPRTKKIIESYGFEEMLNGITLSQPLSFLDMVALEQAAACVLTDSGGVQKESFFYKVPCITMRDETEWIETVDLGWNTLVGASTKKIAQAFTDSMSKKFDLLNAMPYGVGDSAQKIIDTLINQ